jgi:glycogen synthase
MIGRLDPQKGFDLLADAGRGCSRRGRIVVQGPATTRSPPLRRRSPSSPDRVGLIERFDRAMARRIYAGADFS